MQFLSDVMISKKVENTVPKHKQTASLGNLSNYVSTPESSAPEQETVYDRVDRLERRLATVEMLLNDVMIQLDKPVQKKSLGDNPKVSKRESKPKVKPPNVTGRPKKVVVSNNDFSEPEPPPQKKPESATFKECDSSDLLSSVDAQALEAVREFLSDGKRIEYRQVHSCVHEKYGVGKKPVKRVLQYLQKTSEVIHSVETIDDKKTGFITLVKQT